MILTKCAACAAPLAHTAPRCVRCWTRYCDSTCQHRANYARTLYESPAATLDDLHEAVTTLEETARTTRRFLGGAHPLTTGSEAALKISRATLRARETPSGNA